MDEDKLTEKIQVLLSPRDIQFLNNIMLGKAIQIGKPPSPLSTFIRAVIRKYIKEETAEQFKYSDKEVKKLIEKRIQDSYIEKLKENNK